MPACPSCRFDNPPGFRFCGQCSAPLAVVCGNCGAEVPAGFRFCGQCAAPVDAQAVGSGAPPGSRVESRAAPVAERRLVSVLFADLVGFTTLSESRDPEEVRELLSRYFDTAREIVERYGGVVEKFIGDAVMAVWGTPTVYEDDAERAVRAALDLVEAVGSLGEEVGAPNLTARAGVLTGEAAVTIGAAGQGMVAGDLVNTASRLQSAAEPGTVLVGESTFLSAARAIVFAEATTFTPKGKAEAIRTWRALRVVAQRQGVGRSEALEPPFVGRSEELRLIKELSQATARERKVRLVSVTGIAGIGKSRLSWEFLKYVDGLADTIYWHHGRSPAYGEGIAFWALGEMVRMRAQIAETEDPSESRRKLSAAAHEYVSDAEERKWVEPRLAHLLGLEDRPPGEREELFAAWRCFFERIAERGPTAMVFEDLQWADQGLLDFIDSMLEWSRSYPIFVLTLARPELVEKRRNWGAGQRNFTAIHLEPLPDEAMAKLIEGFVRGLPADGVQRILARAEGVPLYAVETVRMLADRGVLAPGADAYEVVGEIGDIDVPDTLHALIAARLDALPAEDRIILQDAAVLGKSFTLEALSAVAGETQEPRLRELVRKEFLAQQVDPRSPERGQYVFVQSLIREVAYGTLAKRDRRAKHLAAAHHFEALGDDELAGIVATHYVEAYQASPEGPDSEAVAARARDWLSQAAERALSLGSPEQALTHFDSALAITPEGAERASLLERAGEAAERLSQWERGAGYLEEAFAIHEAAEDHSSAGLVMSKLSLHLFRLERQEESLGRMEESLSRLAESDTRARAELCTTLAMTCSGMGAFDAALAWADQALPLAERLNVGDLLAKAIGSRASALFNLGRHREAGMLARGRLALAEEVGGLRERAEALIPLGVFIAPDDPRAAQRAWMESAEIARRGGSRDVEVGALSNAAENAIDLGDFAEAEALLAELRTRELDDESRAALAYSEAMLDALRGDATAARRRLDEVVPWSEATGYSQARTWFLRTVATVELGAGDLEAAYDAAAKSLEAEPAGINGPNSVVVAARAALWLGDAERLRSAISSMEVFRGRSMDAVRQTARAGLAALDGRRDEAAEAFTRAEDAWRELDTPLDLALSQLDRVVALGADDPETQAAAGEAREIFAGLGAKPFLERLAAPSADTVPAQP